MRFQTGKLVRDPGRYFENPRDLVECEGLSRRDKLTLLMCWYQDLVENQRARAGFVGSGELPESDQTTEKLRQVMTALSQLRDTVH